MELMQASRQWATRPDDERFTSLVDMRDHFQNLRDNSRGAVVSSRRIEAQPTEDNKGLVVTGPNGHAYGMTHWSFGQLASLAEAPAAYLRTLPAPIAADNINYGLHYKRDIEDVGVLLYKNGGDPILRAVTGPNYGRIWNVDITKRLIERFGDGVTGTFRVPGIWGKKLDQVTKENTTLYAGDRDMFVFLADEDNRVDVLNRRDGQPGSLARGFFCWNSETGKCRFGLGSFLFDFVCGNRIVWGAEQYEEINIIHLASAPDKFIERVVPALELYAKKTDMGGIERAVEEARAAKIDDVDKFLRNRFSKRIVANIKAQHELEEHRPIETLWDASTGITAYARNVAWQDDRVELEREAGKILKLAA